MNHQQQLELSAKIYKDFYGYEHYTGSIYRNKITNTFIELENIFPNAEERERLCDFIAKKGYTVAVYRSYLLHPDEPYSIVITEDSGRYEDIVQIENAKTLPEALFNAVSQLL